jgi:glycosyltransferase involved in cell wall biosynthesis
VAFTQAQLLEIATRHFAGRSGVSLSQIAVGRDEVTSGLDPVVRIVVERSSLSDLRLAVPGAEHFGWLNGSDGRLALAIDRPNRLPFAAAPENFRVVAVIPVLNEIDILPSTIAHLTRNGVESVVVDNWSSDGSFEWATSQTGKGVIEVLRYPEDGPSPTFDWWELLRRIPQIARQSAASWTIFNDADELRDAPWPGMSLRDALWHVDGSGFNCVNLTLINFDLTVPYISSNATDELRHFTAGSAADMTQTKMWRSSDSAVDIHSSGGHTIKMDGRRVFPYNFLQRHYPYRNESQLREKVRLRVERRPPRERMMNWGYHYKEAPSVSLFHDRLINFASDSFHEDWLLERLTGIGWRTEIQPFGWKHRVARLARGRSSFR